MKEFPELIPPWDSKELARMIHDAFCQFTDVGNYHWEVDNSVTVKDKDFLQKMKIKWED